MGLTNQNVLEYFTQQRAKGNQSTIRDIRRSFLAIRHEVIDGNPVRPFLISGYELYLQDNPELLEQRTFFETYLFSSGEQLFMIEMNSDQINCSEIKMKVHHAIVQRTVVDMRLSNQLGENFTRAVSAHLGIPYTTNWWKENLPKRSHKQWVNAISSSPSWRTEVIYRRKDVWGISVEGFADDSMVYRLNLRARRLEVVAPHFRTEIAVERKSELTYSIER